MVLKNWMENFVISDVQVVRDYKQIRCDEGMLLKDLDPVEMGCYPKELTLWQKIFIGSSVCITIIFVIAIIAISRRWDEVKLFMYLHFDILYKNDGKENLDGIESDTFVSHR